jgi:hypothetical protein
MFCDDAANRLTAAMAAASFETAATINSGAPAVNSCLVLPGLLPWIW